MLDKTETWNLAPNRPEQYETRTTKTWKDGIDQPINSSEFQAKTWTTLEVHETWTAETRKPRTTTEPKTHEGWAGRLQFRPS